MQSPLVQTSMRVQLSSRVDAGFTLGSDEVPYSYRSLKQVHGAAGRNVDQYFVDRSEEGDWLMTDDAQIALGIRVADCTAVLAEGLFEGRPMVLAAHAGWRGTAAGIVNRVSEIMKNWSDLRIWLSPSIAQCRFEVGGEVLEALGQDSKPFARKGERPEKYYLNLKAFQEMQIRNLLPQAKISGSSLCTFEQPEFFSYRRLGSLAAGRHTAWIKITG
jgi:YfiH family protein